MRRDNPFVRPLGQSDKINPERGELVDFDSCVQPIEELIALLENAEKK